MISLKSHTRESVGHSELMDTLENAEQSLIDHMRTAGLKKTRECQLIDELLDLRKKRRQAFVLLIKDIANSKTLQEDETVKSNHQMSQLKQIISGLQSELKSKEGVMRNMQNEFGKKVQEVKAKCRREIADEVERVEGRYQKTLSLLEAKIEHVQQATGGRGRQREEEAQQLQRALESNQQRSEEHMASLQKYKDALRSMAEKEQGLKDLYRKKSAQVDLIEAENRQQKKSINALAEKLKVAEGKVNVVNSSQHRSDQRVAQLEERCRLLEDKETASRTATAEALSDLQSRHEQELRRVDGRVRGALRGKDEAIARLQGRLEEALQEGREAAALLQDLNSNITTASSSRSGGRRL